MSVPTWNSISFLDTTVDGRDISFGVFGYTGSKVTVGYSLNSTVLGFDDTRLNSAVIHNLTFVLILHPIAAGLAGLSVLFGLCGLGYHRAGTVIMSLLAALATLVTLVAWVVDLVLWGIARNRIRDNGGSAMFGNANWLTLGALVALFLGFCAGCCGSFGRYRRRGVDRV